MSRYIESFDLIFAGGGTTACVTAGRLAAADPFLKILVIERGQHTRDVPSHVQPGRLVEHISPNTTVLSFHVGKPSRHLVGRAPVFSTVRAVGGAFAVNSMMYVRGAASDYDDWARLGNEGWSFNEVLPLIKKLETFTPISGQPTHGYSGPIQISACKTDFGIGSQFLEVGKAYDPECPQMDDPNDFNTPNASVYGRVHSYIDPVTGKRSDSASRYLYPHSDSPNLKILVGKRVKRVIIENGRAVGVDYTSEQMSNSNLSHGEDLVTVKANKMVIVSAGTFGSPTILERSGIGAPSVLERNNVDTLVNLPGVGENFQDHYVGYPVFYASDDTETMDGVWSDPEATPGLLEEWEVHGTGKISHSGLEALMKVRPTAAQLASAGPHLQSRWDAFFRHYSDKPMAIITPVVGCVFRHSLLTDRKLFTAVYYILYPESVGRVHITSGEDVNASLDFDPNIFSKPGDIAQLQLLYKMARERARRMPAYRGEVTATHPHFPVGSPAACRETDVPVPIDVPDIVYSEADDAAIVKFLRERVSSGWHFLGTCAMKPRNQGGVVDARLNVYGIAGLKVADLSICPTNVGNNPCSTALLIGEKAASIIAEDLGIKLRDD